MTSLGRSRSSASVGQREPPEDEKTAAQDFLMTSATHRLTSAFGPGDFSQCHSTTCHNAFTTYSAYWVQHEREHKSGDAGKSDGKKSRKREQSKKRKRSISTAVMMTLHSLLLLWLSDVVRPHGPEVIQLLASPRRRTKWKRSGSIIKR